MTQIKNEAGNLLPMTVTEGITVNVLPNEAHEYLMTTREVANGYGTSTYAVSQALHRHSEELQEGKHFVTALTICQSDLPKQLRCAHNAILFTKRGIVRLGFFIKSERAKMFRDWAEELIIKVDQLQQAVAVPKLALPLKKRLINRLDRNRMVRLLAMAAKIEDSSLRVDIVDELMGGFNYDLKEGGEL